MDFIKIHIVRCSCNALSGPPNKMDAAIQKLILYSVVSQIMKFGENTT